MKKDLTNKNTLKQKKKNNLITEDDENKNGEILALEFTLVSLYKVEWRRVDWRGLEWSGVEWSVSY